MLADYQGRRRPAEPNNWGAFGPDDELGTLNYLSPAAVQAGAATVLTGARFPLQLPLDLPARGAGGLRPAYQRVAYRINEDLMGLVCNDDYVVLALQGSTQWDSLIHAGAREDGVDGIFYNGVGTEGVDAAGFAHRNGIDKVARQGIVGRGVLVDVARFVGGGRDDALPRDFQIGPELIAATLDHQHTTVQTGDIVCLRTGWTEQYLAADEAGRLELVAPASPHGSIVTPGITADVAELAHTQRWAAVVADNPAVESTPMPETGSAHVRMLRNLGLTFGELFYFRDLAVAADADRRWEFFFVAAPLLVPGGMGSPGCAIAIR